MIEQPDQSELEQLSQRYTQLISLLAELSRKSAHTNSPELLAVSKGQEVEKIRRLYQLGQRRFGENYYQELHAKKLLLADLAIEWVYIGRLQSNKIRKIVEDAAEIQTVGSLRHADLIAKAAKELKKTPYPIYLAINADAEPQKSGVALEEAKKLATQITQEHLSDLAIQGVMAIPSSQHLVASSTVPDVYQKLRTLADQIGQKKLSLGMSGDLAIAIKAGSNLVRIGTALMGPRSQNTRKAP